MTRTAICICDLCGKKDSPFEILEAKLVFVDCSWTFDVCKQCCNAKLTCFQRLMTKIRRGRKK